MSSTHEVLLGIDIGSTSLRCCIFDLDARQLDQISYPTTRVLQKHGRWEKEYRAWDPTLLWLAVLDLLKETGEILKANHYRPLGAAVTSVGCSSVMLDSHGEPLFPVISYKSGESALLIKYQQAFNPAEFQKITGYPLAPTTSWFIWSLLKGQYPDTFAKISLILPVSNFITYRLTGGKAADRSIVGSFGIWDHTQDRLWNSILEDLELDPTVFGSIVNGGEPIGVTSPEITGLIGFREPLPIFSGGHDYLCAALAVGCTRPGQIFNIEGTFEITATFHTAPVQRAEDDRTRCLMDIHVLPHTYSLMTERIGSGQIEWLKNLLYPAEANAPQTGTGVWETMLAEIQTLDSVDQQEEIFIPYLFGQLFPQFNPQARGAVLGLNTKSSRAAIMRAAMLSHCYESKRMLAYHQTFLNLESLQMISVGGITRNQYWMQMKSDILGVPILAPELKEASALGAAMLAGLGCGRFDHYQQIGEVVQSRGTTIYRPDTARTDQYLAYFERNYLPAVSRLSDSPQ